MCGGIVGALTLGIPGKAQGGPDSRLRHLLAYNGGRIASYTLAGALVGGVGGMASRLGAVHRVQLSLQLLAAAFMIALGLYVAGWWRGLAAVERAGGWLIWRRLQPLGRRLLPVRSAAAAFPVGLVWGWLPCGLVYSVLIWAVASGSAAQGAMLMLSFGLGTLPTLLAMGAFAAALASLVRRPVVRRVAGLAVVGVGLMQAARALGW
jgi:sulfite exporter TauE/SafE